MGAHTHPIERSGAHSNSKSGASTHTSDAKRAAAVAEPRKVSNAPAISSETDFDAVIAFLRAELRADPSSATKWNDLGVCLVHKNDGDGALIAFGEALLLDPTHADARANLRLVLDTLYGNEGRPMPVAPGSWGCNPGRNPIEDLKAILGAGVRVIVDGGSHKGDSVTRLRAAFPGATIHAFEALPEFAQGLRTRFAEDRGLVVHAAALAEEGGRLRMRITGDASLSTLHEPSALERRCRNTDHAGVAEQDVLALPLRDAVQGGIDLLHLDLNGGEAAALLGAGERLHGVRSLLVRVALQELHVGGPVFSDLDVFLRAQGFRLFHLYNLWCHADGQVTSAAALYTNERHFS
ncbi:MAG: FkbM family methyltransferase [Planctomycetes bacterium]|nr:FkbM family methyltransferase [Planctomycetota bacterium]